MPKIYLTGNRLPQAAAARKAYLHGPFMFIYLEITCYSRVKCVVEDVIHPRQGRRPEYIQEIPKEMPNKFILNISLGNRLPLGFAA